MNKMLPASGKKLGFCYQPIAAVVNALGFQCDRQLQREVAPGLPHRPPIAPQGQMPSFDAQVLEGAHLLRLGRQPRQAGMLDHVVEREQTPEENFPRGHPAVADVFGAQCLVDPPAEDAAHFLVFQSILGGEPFADQGLDESKGLPAAHLEIEGKLRARLKTPSPCRQARAIHSASGPVQPKGSSAVSRPWRWAIIAS